VSVQQHGDPRPTSLGASEIVAGSLWMIPASALERREAHEHVHDQLLSAPERHRDGLTPSRNHLEVSRSSQTRRRRLQALVLVAVAIGLVVVEPFPKG
jgi:hypothetical protein